MLNVNMLAKGGKPALKCFIIDAEKAEANKLETFIRKTPGLEFIGTEADAQRAEPLLIDRKSLVDIVFLDIEPENCNGLKLARLLMGKVPVVFTTTHSQYAVESYRLNVVDYLIKPISYPLFLEAVSKCSLAREILTYAEPVSVRSLFIKDALSGKSVNVNQQDILYIQSLGNYCKVFLANKNQIMPHISLKQLLSKLRSDLFVRIHKTFVINLNYLSNYGYNGTVKMKNEIELEVGRTFKKKLKQEIKLM